MADKVEATQQAEPELDDYPAELWLRCNPEAWSEIALYPEAYPGSQAWLRRVRRKARDLLKRRS